MRPELALIHPDVVSVVGAIGGAAFRRTVWEKVVNAADRYNDPGKFTAFIGYEWTPTQTFLHRVVLFKDGAAKAGAVPPFSALDSARAEDLWAHLADYEKKTGGEVLAIPHNSNLTKGRMFLTRDSDGRPFTQDYAETRIRFESLFEVTQNKGDSETHPELSPDDEFADYERLKGIAPVKRHINLFTNFRVLTDGRPNLCHYTGWVALRSGLAPVDRQTLPSESIDMTVSDAIGGGTRFRSLEMAATGSPEDSYSFRSADAINPPVGAHIDALTIINGLDFEHALTGHALAGTKKDAAESLRYLEELASGVAAGIAADRSLAEIQKSLTLETFKGFERWDTLREAHIASVYATLKGANAGMSTATR